MYHPDDEALIRQTFADLSTNELVSACHSVGLRAAHKGMARDELTELFLRHDDAAKSPVDKHRAQVMKVIASGTVSIDCHGNCFLHSDAKVMQCYLALPEG